ncbi:tRNA 2-thiouridine(34) synthase MnmA [Candidatus Kaiserbacteria bacterium]|nr:tRNA 2-thiouridine(34) synthase MnmA [Candidatus Kaiserbacteria bacterium]
MHKRVFVGLSGGVDSATSAALLLEQGYDVTGVFIRIWKPEFLECTWREDRLDAMRVAAYLDIPFREIDLSDDYERTVVRPMIDGYSRGKTPNPDLLCNKTVKFGSFLRFAREAGADAVATGHYARIQHVGSSFMLLRGTDPAKDQSYFLHQLNQEQLAHAIFPVGGMTKRDVRAEAVARGLPVAAKHDSQGLCFVGDVAMSEFLQRYLRVEPGPVCDAAGAVIGAHDGAALYTVGQRHGFRLDAAHPGMPYYVTRIDTACNTVIVSPRLSDACRTTIPVDDPHWIGDAIADGTRVAAMTRYRGALADATYRVISGETQLQFDRPQLAPPGQSVVMYDGDLCLGGAPAR